MSFYATIQTDTIADMRNNQNTENIIIEKKNITISKYDRVNLGFTQLYQYRRFILIFAIREIKLQYSQTILGILWSIITPLTGLLIYSLFFTKIILLNTGGIPYPVFVLAGLAAWYYFTYLVGSGGSSVIQAQSIIKKIYFPKLVLPLSKAVVGLVNLVIILALLIIYMLITGYFPCLNIIFLPVVILFNMITGLSLGIWLSALTIRYRDFHHIIPYTIGFGIWLTPVFYPVSILPESYQFFMFFNPMAAVAEGYRWALAGTPFPSINYLFSIIPVLILLAGGLYYFRKIEGKMVDMV
ncbi:MAG: ABC transporter permease [Bacteroidia bacterium]|nr:ABC transporter permease [Bacteroidia bacterium]